MPPCVSFNKKLQTKNISVEFFYLPSQRSNRIFDAFVGRLSAATMQGKKGGGLEPCRRFRIDQSVHGKFNTALL